MINFEYANFDAGGRVTAIINLIRSIHWVLFPPSLRCLPWPVTSCILHHLASSIYQWFTKEIIRHLCLKYSDLKKHPQFTNKSYSQQYNLKPACENQSEHRSDFVRTKQELGTEQCLNRVPGAVGKEYTAPDAPLNRRLSIIFFSQSICFSPVLSALFTFPLGKGTKVKRRSWKERFSKNAA